jgi:hypothetical protein
VNIIGPIGLQALHGNKCPLWTVFFLLLLSLSLYLEWVPLIDAGWICYHVLVFTSMMEISKEGIREHLIDQYDVLLLCAPLKKEYAVGERVKLRSPDQSWKMLQRKKNRCGSERKREICWPWQLV